MEKRVFVGIFASLKLKRKVFALRRKFYHLPVRWIPDENLHLTLIPPLELDDKGIVEMIEKSQTLEGKIGQIKIKFNRLSFGPNPRRPRLIWIEGKSNQKLVELKNRITRILGLRAEGRLFKPHLTIARFKPKDYFNFPTKDLDEKISWSFLAESICVIQSECLEEGARYTNLSEIKL